MSDGESTGGWPPPHPSPPLPPVRGSGVPGAPPSRAPYVVGAAAVLAVVLVVLLAVVLLSGGDDEPEGTAPPAEASSAPATDEVGPAGATCWDGSAAESVDACSAPTGADGLAWVFPGYADARCGQAQAAGGLGVVTRVLCIRRLAGGAKAQLGYFEWASPADAQAFYDGQGLTRTDGSEVIAWSGTDGDTAKGATTYVEQPYSVTVTYPASYTLTPEDQAALAPRPVAEVRGAPVG